MLFKHIVVAVGGDGSLAEVVEGFFEPASHNKVSETGMLAYVPNGTGGDFRYVVATISRLLKIIGLFCIISSFL